MITLRILGHKVKMPNKLNEIPMGQGIQIMNIIGEKGVEPDLKTKLSIISLLTNIDVTLLIHFEESSINEIYSKFEFFKPELHFQFYKTFKVKGRTFGMLDFDNITVREWADIEFWLSEGDDPFTHLGDLTSIIFRPVEDLKQSRRNNSMANIFLNIKTELFYRPFKPKFYKEYKIEKLKEDHIGNSEFFLQHLDFEFGYGIFYFITEFKKILRSEYKLLFKTDEQIKNEAEDPYKAQEEMKEFSDWWGFYHLVSEVSENLFERDAWWNKPLREFYKFLSYNKQKALYEKNGKG
jgi:hypothetical protein